MHMLYNPFSLIIVPIYILYQFCLFDMVLFVFYNFCLHLHSHKSPSGCVLIYKKYIGQAIRKLTRLTTMVRSCFLLQAKYPILLSKLHTSVAEVLDRPYYSQQWQQNNKICVLHANNYSLLLQEIYSVLEEDQKICHLNRLKNEKGASHVLGIRMKTLNFCNQGILVNINYDQPQKIFSSSS